jgi:hypothetical protein
MGQSISQWNPLTLQGAGLFHIAMGAVLGIAAFGRTQEKLAGSANNTPVASAPTIPTAVTPVVTPAPIPKPMLSAQVPVTLDPNDPPTRNTRND